VTIEDVRTSPLELIPQQRQRDTTTATPATPPIRVLAVGINFGPEHTGIAPYTTQLCEHLADEGMHVTVFTGIPHYPSWTVGAEDKWRLRRTEKHGRLEVRRLRHYVPKKQSAIKRAWYELSFALNVAAQGLKERPDVVLAVVPSLFSAVVAKRIAAKAGVPLIVWVQDLMGNAAAQSGMSGGSKVASLVAAVEKHVLRAAEQVLVLNSHFADYVKSTGVDAGRVAIRPNWSHIAQRSTTDPATTRRRLGWATDEVIVLHTGNMGLKQNLQNVIDAARIAAASHSINVRFILMGDGSQRAGLQSAAADVPSVQFMDPAPPNEYLDILRAANALLVNEIPESIDMSLPSKLTSYFAAGRPVIASSPALGGTAAQVQSADAGIVVDPSNPEDLVLAVTHLLNNKNQAITYGNNGRVYAQRVLSANRAIADTMRVMSDVHRRHSAKQMTV
jgi:colanic acid biosynthesis glycosyl transferase WcaI